MLIVLIVDCARVVTTSLVVLLNPSRSMVDQLRYQFPLGVLSLFIRLEHSSTLYEVCEVLPNACQVL